MDFAIGQKGEMMGDLKPCPFCGRIPDIEDCGEHRWFIRCKCGNAQDKLFFQKCDAVKAWNKRKELRVKDTNVPITDTISRQAVLNVLDEIEAQYVFDDGHDRLLQYAKNKVAALPCEYPTPLETIHCTNEQIERLRNTILNALHEPTVVRCGKCKYLTDTVSEFDPELHLCAFGLWMPLPESYREEGEK